MPSFRPGGHSWTYQRLGLGHPWLDGIEPARTVLGCDVSHFPLMAAGRVRDRVASVAINQKVH